MTDADVQLLLEQRKIQIVAADPETARAELETARSHIASAEKIMAEDPTLAFTALYDAMRKAIAAHMRSRGYRVTRGPGAHMRTGEYARAALDHLDVDRHVDEFDLLRDLRHQAEYEARPVDVEEVPEALVHARAVVDAIDGDL